MPEDQPPSMNITVIVENHARSGLVSEHGLSLWVESDEGGILFDTGQGPALAFNAPAMNIPLETARAVVLSHGHYDHTGGLPYALRRAAGADLYLHPDAVQPRFSIHDEPRSIGMPPDAAAAVRHAAARTCFTRKPVEVAPGVSLTGPIPRRTDFEDSGGPFFLDAAGDRPDSIPDDQALWIDTPGGSVVVLGCAHAGVVNSLEYVHELSGRRPIRAVMGGLHLAAASMRRLEKTAGAFRQFGVRMMVAGHCTGTHAFQWLDRALPGRMVACHAGATFTFGKRGAGCGPGTELGGEP